MDFSTNFKICGSGLAAQRAKMDVVSSNLANAGTTKTEEGGPDAIFAHLLEVCFA